MRATRLFPLLAAICALLPATAATAAPNVPLCLALENNFNECMRQQQRQNAGGGWSNGARQGYGQEYRQGYGRRGYDQGYGHERGWGDNEWDDGYGRHQRQYPRQGGGRQSECARWLYAIQQNNCAR